MLTSLAPLSFSELSSNHFLAFASMPSVSVNPLPPRIIFSSATRYHNRYTFTVSAIELRVSLVEMLFYRNGTHK